MKFNLHAIASIVCLAIASIASFAPAAPISVDGVLGAEWSGANVENVIYNAAAPTSNFGAPTNQNHEVAYDILTRGDTDYFYVGLTTTGPYTGGLNFANLYFSTTLLGSTIGFETTNQTAFRPGFAGSYPYTPGSHDIHNSVTAGTASTPSVIEFAVPWEVFTDNSLGLDVLTPPSTAVRLNLSQSFGYSVAGGTAIYGENRLGTVNLPVPEPTAAALLSLGAFGVTIFRRRRN